MADFIQFVLSNFTLTFLVVGFIFAFISLVFKHKPLQKKQIIEAIFSYFLLFSIGISYLYNFVMHVFFAEMTAAFIGWANSPFQYEVGFASLGFAIVGLLAFRQGLAFRAASIIGPSFFLWGAAGGHVYQMITSHNFAPGNAGIIFWTDIFLPVIAFVLLYLQYSQEKSENLADSKANPADANRF
jgi:MFS family permease